MGRSARSYEKWHLCVRGSTWMARHGWPDIEALYFCYFLSRRSRATAAEQKVMCLPQPNQNIKLVFQCHCPSGNQSSSWTRRLISQISLFQQRSQKDQRILRVPKGELRTMVIPNLPRGSAGVKATSENLANLQLSCFFESSDL